MRKRFLRQLVLGNHRLRRHVADHAGSADAVHLQVPTELPRRSSDRRHFDSLFGLLVDLDPAVDDRQQFPGDDGAVGGASDGMAHPGVPHGAAVFPNRAINRSL